MEPLTILTALMPALTDGVRGLINKFTGGAGAQPANVEEAVKLVDADIRRLEALSRLDQVQGEVSLWVSNIRALQRPVASTVIVISWLGLMAYHGGTDPDTVINISSNLASAVIFYLFGDRTYMHFKRNRN